MQEEADDALVHEGAFGEGEGFAHEAGEALAQGVVKAFNVVGGATMIGGLVLFWRKDVVIAVQVSGLEVRRLVGGRNPTPEQPGGGIPPGTEGRGDDLTGTAALRPTKARSPRTDDAQQSSTRHPRPVSHRVGLGPAWFPKGAIPGLFF